MKRNLIVLALVLMALVPVSVMAQSGANCTTAWGAQEQALKDEFDVLTAVLPLVSNGSWLEATSRLQELQEEILPFCTSLAVDLWVSRDREGAINLLEGLDEGPYTTQLLAILLYLDWQEEEANVLAEEIGMFQWYEGETRGLIWAQAAMGISSHDFVNALHRVDLPEVQTSDIGLYHYLRASALLQQESFARAEEEIRLAREYGYNEDDDFEVTLAMSEESWSTAEVLLTGFIDQWEAATGEPDGAGVETMIYLYSLRASVREHMGDETGAGLDKEVAGALAFGLEDNRFVNHWREAFQWSPFKTIYRMDLLSQEYDWSQSNGSFVLRQLAAAAAEIDLTWFTDQVLVAAEHYTQVGLQR